MNRISRHSAILLGACAIASLAHAAPTKPADPGATQIEEVVVTAERREERLQDVPIAVSVISSEALKNSNFTGLTNLQFLVPSLQYNAYTGGGFQIRGVGTQSVNLSTEQDVGIVIDDVVQGIPETNYAAPSYQALGDIDRIEVLMGPQGTLFGKNSSVGVVQIVTKKPEFDAWAGTASLSYGTDNEIRAQATLNVPLADDLAARISAYDMQRDGYITNEYNGKKLSGYDQTGVRGKLLWQPTEDLSVYLIGEGGHTSDSGNGILTLRSCGSGFLGFNACQTDAPYGIVAGPNNRKVAVEGYTGSDTTTGNGSLHIDYQLWGGTLTSVTAYQSKDESEGVDVDSSPRPILSVDVTHANSNQITQEIRFASAADRRLEYTVGAFFYDVNSTERNVLAGTFGFLPDDSPILLSNGFASPVTGGQTVIDSHTKSYAAFGQATYHITDKWQVIGGLRFTHDDVNAGVYIAPFPNICEFNYAFDGICHTTTLPSPRVATNASDSNVSGKVTAKYDFSDTVNAYATFATGYKGPAVSYPAGLPQFVVKPETSRDYEIGVKSQWLDRHLTLNADIFYEKFTNFQGQTFVVDPNNKGASNFVTANAGGLESKGVEVNASYLAGEDLSLTGNLAYTPTRFTEFAIQCADQFQNPATIPGQCTYYPPGISPPTPAQFNAKGYPLTNAPKFTYTLGASYHHEVFSGYTFSADGNWVWRSRSYTLVADPNSIVNGYGLLGINLGVAPTGGAWKVSFFSRNLLDQHFVAGIFKTYLDNDSGLAPPPLPIQGYANIPSVEARRTIGIKLDYRFGE